MQVNAVSITAKFVQMDIEIEGGPIEVDDYDFNHTRPSRPPRVGFLVSLISAAMCGGGVLLSLLGLVVFFRGWTNVLERAMMADEYSDDDDSARPWKKRTERLVVYVIIIAVELIFVFMMIRVLIPWAYTKTVVAMRVEPGGQFAFMLHSSIWLIAGLIIYATLHGILVAQELAFGLEPTYYDRTVTIAQDNNNHTTEVYMLESSSDDDDDGSEISTTDGTSYDDDYTDTDDYSYDEDAELLLGPTT